MMYVHVNNKQETKEMGKLLGNATDMEVFWTANLRKSEAKLQVT